MKALMFGWEYPPHITGGLGVACQGLVEGLVENGVEVTLVLPRGPAGEPDERPVPVSSAPPGPSQPFKKVAGERKSPILIRTDLSLFPSPYHTGKQGLLNDSSQFGSTDGDGTGTRPPSMMDGASNYTRDLPRDVALFAKQGSLYGSRGDFDVIHAHDWMTFPAGVHAKEISDKPLVLHVHSTEFDRNGEDINPGVFSIECQGFHHADRVVAVSAYTKKILVDRYHVPAEKIEVVHNGIHPLRPAPRRKGRKRLVGKTVLFLGRITRQKGPDTFIEAARIVLDRMAHVRFVMAGSGDMLPEMISKVASMNMAGNFHFTGFLEREEVDSLFSMSDLFAMPSRSEPYGLVPFEALRHRVPVIISKVSGAAELLSDAPTVDPEDPHGLAVAMLSMLQNRAQATLLMKRCRETLRSLDWSHAALRVKALYRSLQPYSDIQPDEQGQTLSA